MAASSALHAPKLRRCSCWLPPRGRWGLGHTRAAAGWPAVGSMAAPPRPWALQGKCVGVAFQSMTGDVQSVGEQISRYPSLPRPRLCRLPLAPGLAAPARSGSPALGPNCPTIPPSLQATSSPPAWCATSWTTSRATASTQASPPWWAGGWGWGWGGGARAARPQAAAAGQPRAAL